LTNFYAYDADRRKTGETNANGHVLLYTYNPAGDLLSPTDGKNQTTQWKYDEYGRVTNKLDQTSTVILKYVYDDSNGSNAMDLLKTPVRRQVLRTNGRLTICSGCYELF
jgi:YD repeat-containing protein